MLLEELKKIVNLLVKDVQHRLSQQQISLTVDSDATELIVSRAYDPMYGARPLKRYLQRELETRIGRLIIGGDVGEGSSILVTVEDDELAIRCDS